MDRREGPSRSCVRLRRRVVTRVLVVEVERVVREFVPEIEVERADAGTPVEEAPHIRFAERGHDVLARDPILESGTVAVGLDGAVPSEEPDLVSARSPDAPPEDRAIPLPEPDPTLLPVELAAPPRLGVELTEEPIEGTTREALHTRERKSPITGQNRS